MLALLKHYLLYVLHAVVSFQAYDERNSGFIDKNELKNILMNTGERLDRNEGSYKIFIFL